SFLVSWAAIVADGAIDLEAFGPGVPGRIPGFDPPIQRFDFPLERAAFAAEGERGQGGVTQAVGAQGVVEAVLEAFWRVLDYGHGRKAYRAQPGLELGQVSVGRVFLIAGVSEEDGIGANILAPQPDDQGDTVHA